MKPETNTAEVRELNRFVKLGDEIGKLVAEKNAAYGDAVGKCGDFLRLLYPAGLHADLYGDALLLVRIFDKCMRIATRKDAFGESPYRDLAGYGILGAAKDDAVMSRERALRIVAEEVDKLRKLAT